MQLIWAFSFEKSLKTDPGDRLALDDNNYEVSLELSLSSRSLSLKPLLAWNDHVTETVLLPDYSAG
jgi:hypothetical protein